MRTIYCSDDLAGDRRKGWRDLIGTIYAPLDIDIPTRPDFFGRICRSHLGDIELTEVRTDSESAHRTPRHIMRDRCEAFVYLLVRAGEINVVQFGRECTIGAGDFTLVHLNSPYRFRHKARVDKLGIKIPAAMMPQRPGQLAAHCAVPGRAAAGLPRLVAAFADSLCGEDERLADEEAYRLSITTGDLFTLLFGTRQPAVLPDETPVRAALRRRCQAYIDARWPDPDLGPASIAAALGISVRYLHQCFAASDVSVMDYVRAQRLKRCRIDLADPACDRLPIAEIALRNGFRNVCHFNQAFKAAFGATPRDVRRGRNRPAVLS
jgi:AraC-like DNA-binding protein